MITIEQLLSWRAKLWAKLDDLARKKGADYSGIGADTFLNLRAVEQFGLPAEIGVMVRVSDKFARIWQLLMRSWLSGKQAQVSDESIDDSIQDAVNYLSYILALRAERKGDFDAQS
jgi:hypothetical protein